MNCLRALLLALSLAFGMPAQGDEVYELTVVPQFSATEIHRDWQPLLERLQAMTGLRLKLRHARSIPEFEADFSRGGPDLAYMNPYHAVMARKAQGYVPLVRAGRSLAGILVVRKDGNVRKLADLAGSELAFPAPNAFGASLYMRALLKEGHGLRVVPRYVKTHSNVFRAVLAGDVPAGGAIRSTLAQEPEAIRERLQVLFETPAAAPHPIVAHPRVPEKVRQAIAEAILRLRESEGGQKLLADCQLSDPVRADYGRDYQPLERLQLEKYVVRSE